MAHSEVARSRHRQAVCRQKWRGRARGACKVGLKARRCRSLEQLGPNLPDPEFPDPYFPEHGAQFGGELRTVYGPSGQLGDHRKVRPKALRWLQGPRSAAIRPAVRATTPPT